MVLYIYRKSESISRCTIYFLSYMRQNVYVLHNILSSSYSLLPGIIINSTIRNIIILLGIDYNSMHAIILD